MKHAQEILIHICVCVLMMCMYHSTNAICSSEKSQKQAKGPTFIGLTFKREEGKELDNIN